MDYKQAQEIYSEQLEMLASLGFTDIRANVDALQQTSGVVDQAVQILVEEQEAAS